MKFVSNFISKNRNIKPHISLLGVPYDRAVIAEGGRSGSASGPKQVRLQLHKYHKTYNLKHGIDLSPLIISDAGDIKPAATITKTHDRINQKVQTLLLCSEVVITIGGGHDLSRATMQGLTNSLKKPIGCINIDAHFDVKKRSQPTSGSPFYFALKENNSLFRGENFVEIGMHDNFNSFEDYQFLVNQKASIFPLAKVRDSTIDRIISRGLEIAGKETAYIHFSIDMDSVAEAFAPGVSAPSSDGFNPAEIIRITYLAGTHPKVKTLDLVEINPKYDIQNRTARLGATMIVAFFTGYMQRQLLRQKK